MTGKYGVKSGVVTMMNEQKGYGFINDDCFFHTNFGARFFYDGDDAPSMVKNEAPPLPTKGTRLIYLDEHGPKSDRAKWWGFQTEYDDVMEQIKKRPTILVIERNGPKATSKLHQEGAASNEILLETNNLFNIRRFYPKAHHPVVLDQADYAFFFTDREGNVLADPR